MSRYRRSRVSSSPLFASILAIVLGACASRSETVAVGSSGDLTVVTTRPSEAPEAERDSAGSVGRELEDSVDTPGLDFDSLVAVIRDEAAGPRPRSILPFGITWTPTQPIEGSAIAFRVLSPRGGLEPEAVVGRLAGRIVRFGRLEGTWLGLAAVPIDTHGRQRLELEFRFADGSAYEQAVDLDVAARDWEETSLSVAPKYSSPPPEVQDRIARDREEIRAVLDRASPEWLLDGPFESPRPYDVTAEFGQRRVFNGELQSRHTGLDLRGQTGKPVYAAGRGRVALTGDFYFSGNGIFLDHGLGVYTGYFHLSEILVSEGEVVEKGDLIGRAGATGRVTGPHLHWSLWVDGTGQDAGSLLQMEIPGP
ncbi:MAG: M23 family metallopeptidase [Candidatus Palauibacterales bacterium]|nr:M23 family metallopeptidase [Candidatus Palauibacterales bacterium]MDP2483851.1 M23 family metallopeptidase [Candidatus Palauibacterales bacterium]